MIAVVGSGPAGIACASALLARGEEVLILDGGNALEPEREAAAARLGAQEIEAWSQDDLAIVKRQGPVSTAGVTEKLVYGSDFPFRDADRVLRLLRKQVDGVASLAVGGFSHVWGASMLPYRAEDITDWPFPLDELAPHYRTVAEEIPVSARADDLARLLPLYAEPPGVLRASEQGRTLLADLDAHRGELRAAGFHHGHARLAVRADGCRYCGLCMYGCPYGLIYRSTDQLQTFVKQGRTLHEPGWIVTSVAERGKSVEIHASGRSGGEPRSWIVDRVFLAAGAFPTTKILLASLDAYDRPLRMLDSEHFFFPLMRLRGAGRVDQERLHTLAQLFIEILDPEVSAHTVHLQLYSYNDLYEQVFKGMLGPAMGLVAPALRALLGRLWIVRGFFHSAESPGLTATLRHADGGDALDLQGEVDGMSRERVRRVVRKFREHRRAFRGEPIEPMVQVFQPGRSKHFGASFPMRREPKPFESDTLGRPHGFHRVHAVDASVFPSMPATTVTYSVMANAHRIGASWREDE